MPELQIGSASRFSPRASLAAIGLKLQELKLFETIKDAVHVPQVTPACAAMKPYSVPSADRDAPSLQSFKTRSTPARRRTSPK